MSHPLQQFADSILLENEFLRLTIIPEIGGKIAGFLDKKNNCEWLWQNPHLMHRKPEYGQGYVTELDSGGWDEIFPSVSPCQVPCGRGLAEIPDHGDLVQLPWRVLAASATRVEMEMRGRCYPFLFQRSIEVDGANLHIRYCVENQGQESFPWLWCTHPLLPLEPGLALETEASFQVLYASGAARALEGSMITWEELPARSERWAAKLFSPRKASNGVLVRRECGASLRFAWNREEIPYLGLWVNNGEWSGCGSAPYFNIGIEPATLPVDDLSQAQNPPFLAPGESREWTLQVALNT